MTTIRLPGWTEGNYVKASDGRLVRKDAMQGQEVTINVNDANNGTYKLVGVVDFEDDGTMVLRRVERTSDITYPVSSE